MSDAQLNITEGTNVYGSDGDKVGSVVAIGPNYVVVEKGFFFPTDYYIPTSAIASTDDDGVRLNVTKDAALNQGWDTAPTEETTYVDSGATTYASDAATSVGTSTIGTYDTDNTRGGGLLDSVGGAIGGAADRVDDTVRGSASAGMSSGAGVIGGSFDAASTERISEDEDTIVVPVREEELTATKTAREAGEVRIEKDVISEERTLNVPVTEERVRVERRTVDRPVDASDASFQDEVIEVPLMTEEVELHKRARVAEEVVIDKEQVQRTETVSGTVRREEVRVDDMTTDVTATDTMRTTTTTTDAPMTGDTSRQS